MAIEDADRWLRASDAERENTVQWLQAAFSEGRLTVGEFDERVRTAYAAVTRGDLADLTVDLPPEPPVCRAEPARKPWRDLAAALCVLSLTWAMTSAMSDDVMPFSPVVPIGVWALIMLAGALFRDDSEDDRGDGE
jgi:hypothetical protein